MINPFVNDRDTLVIGGLHIAECGKRLLTIRPDYIYESAVVMAFPSPSLCPPLLGLK